MDGTTGLLQTRKGKFGFRKSFGISSLAASFSAVEESSALRYACGGELHAVGYVSGVGLSLC